MYLLFVLWFAFLDSGLHHGTHISCRKSVQLSLGPLPRDETDLWSLCCQHSDQGAYQRTQGNLECHTGGHTTSASTSWSLKKKNCPSLLKDSFTGRNQHSLRFCVFKTWNILAHFLLASSLIDFYI